MPEVWSDFFNHYVWEEPRPVNSNEWCNCESCRYDRATVEEQERIRREERIARAIEEERRWQERVTEARASRERERRRRAAQRRKEIAKRGRTFGVEMEVHFDEDVDDYTLAQAIERCGVRCNADGYNHDVVSYWKIVSDASVDCGWEIVSPPLHWDERDQIEKVCDAIDRLGGYVEQDCGLHVHHDVQDLTAAALKRVCRIWHDAQPLTDMLVESSRCGHRDYTAPWSEHEVRRIMDCDSVEAIIDASNYIDRYFSLNLQSLGRYGTIEIRQHHGTIDAAEVIAWVAYGQAIIEKATTTRGVVSKTTECRTPASTVAEFIDTLPLKNETVKRSLARKDRTPTPALF